jgi:hypothetical protein
MGRGHGKPRARGISAGEPGKPGRHNSVGSASRTTPAEIRETAVESWPTDETTIHALDDPDVGVDASAFYRWRRNRSEPPPPLGPTGSGLSRYRRRDVA